MKVYIIRNRRKIDPFDEYASECLIGNKKLAVHQKEIFSALGLDPVFVLDISQVDDPGEYIWLDDSLYFTPELLAEFITKSRKRRSDSVCALELGLVTCRTVSATQKSTRVYTDHSIDHVRYDLHYLPEERFRGEEEPIIISPDQIYASIPMPDHISSGGKYLIPVTDRFIIRIGHWVNLWAANIMTLSARQARAEKMSKVKLLALAIKAHSLNRWRILGELNKVGRNCDIHPTAYIEGSEIGDNVAIGAGAIVRMSMVGNHACVGNGVVIEESVVGERGTFLNGHIMYSVFYPNSFSVAQMIPSSIIGRDTFLGSNVVLTDFRLDGENVTVLENGIKVDTENKFVGCCLGHGVYLGAGCVVAPGRIIPSGMHIVLEEGRIIRGCDFSGNIPGFRSVENFVH